MADILTDAVVEEPVVKVAPKKSQDASEEFFWSVGKRKEAIARIKMSLGDGTIVINDVPLEEYLTKPLLRVKMMAPLVLVDRQEAFTISIKVAGGGQIGQMDAIALGIARALLQYDASLRPVLKKGKLLTRDSRVKERKKYGLRRARKAPQYSKR